MRKLKGWIWDDLREGHVWTGNRALSPSFITHLGVLSSAFAHRKTLLPAGNPSDGTHPGHAFVFGNRARQTVTALSPVRMRETRSQTGYTGSIAPIFRG